MQRASWVVAVGLAAIVGCGDDSDTDPSDITTTSTTSASTTGMLTSSTDPTTSTTTDGTTSDGTSGSTSSLDTDTDSTGSTSAAATSGSTGGDGTGSTGDDGTGSTGGSVALCGAQTCMPDENCVGEACSCVVDIHGNTVLRTDGTVVEMTGTPTVVEEGTTGTPLTGVQEIFEGMWHSCALRDDETVWCWARSSNGNISGQLGNGSVGGTPTVFQASVVTVQGGAPLSGVRHLNRGASRSYLAATTCAILDDTSVWCWGDRGEEGTSSGQGFFNDGLTGNRPVATPILAADGVALTNVDEISVGVRHACFLRGTDVWCWATNVGGPLGQSDEVPRQYPVQVSLPGPASHVIAGFDVTCAQVADGVYCWGSNNSGQVGVGTPADNTDGCINFCVTSPQQVMDGDGNPLTGVTDINSAYLANCARRTDDALWCWGAGAQNVAGPLMVGGAAVTDVALHTSAGSGDVDDSIRYLTRQDVYYRSQLTATVPCPS